MQSEIFLKNHGQQNRHQQFFRLIDTLADSIAKMWLINRTMIFENLQFQNNELTKKFKTFDNLTIGNTILSHTQRHASNIYYIFRVLICNIIHLYNRRSYKQVAWQR